MLKKILLALSILMALVGIVWFGQGIGLIHGSVMTDDSKWAIIGAFMVIVAAGIIWFVRRIPK
jgi:hypothetical protein